VDEPPSPLVAPVDDDDVAPAVVPPLDPTGGAASHAATSSTVAARIAAIGTGVDDRRSGLGMASV
jgi:hypothetical protein